MNHHAFVFFVILKYIFRQAFDSRLPLFYDANGHEVDIVQSTDSAVTFTNVCWSMETAETKRREIAGLRKRATGFPRPDWN